MELAQLIDPVVRAVDGFAGECVSMRVSNDYLIITLPENLSFNYSCDIRKLDFTGDF